MSAPDGEGLRPVGDSGGADELRDVNSRLLISGLKAQEQAEAEVTLRVEAEAALTGRDEFISIAAHELRTPVTTIKLGAQLVRRELDKDEPDLQSIDRPLLNILNGANRLESLISDLMDVSRMRSGQLLLNVRPLDLVALVARVAQRYAEASGEQHHVTIDLPATALAVTGDAGRLEQILDNLLSNAVKYSPDGGDIQIQLRQALDGLLLTVSDNGIGLPSGSEERIFEPFGRGDNARERRLPGMGLGLHICRQIAAAHGGRMWAESAGDSRGMTVSMWLPSA